MTAAPPDRMDCHEPRGVPASNLKVTRNRNNEIVTVNEVHYIAPGLLRRCPPVLGALQVQPSALRLRRLLHRSRGRPLRCVPARGSAKAHPPYGPHRDRAGPGLAPWGGCRRDAGLRPCGASPGALVFAEIDDPDAEVRHVLATTRRFRICEQLGTGPGMH